MRTNEFSLEAAILVENLPMEQPSSEQGKRLFSLHPLNGPRRKIMSMSKLLTMCQILFRISYIDFKVHLFQSYSNKMDHEQRTSHTLEKTSEKVTIL